MLQICGVAKKIWSILNFGNIFTGKMIKPFNSLGAGVANKRQYKTGKVPDLPHVIMLTKLQ